MNASFNSLLWGPQSFCFPLLITICNCRFMHVFIYMMTLITHSHIYYPGRLEASWKKKASFQVWLTIIGPTGEGNGTPLQYSCLENPMDGGAWWAAVHGVGKSWTWLSDFTFTFHFHALEKEMATHSSVLAWRIPGTGEPGVLPSMGSHRARHDWSEAQTLLCQKRFI